MSEAGPARLASAAHAAGWPRLAEARGSLRRGLALRGASGGAAGRSLSPLAFDAGVPERRSEDEPTPTPNPDPNPDPNSDQAYLSVDQKTSIVLDASQEKKLQLNFNVTLYHLYAGHLVRVRVRVRVRTRARTPDAQTGCRACALPLTRVRLALGRPCRFATLDIVDVMGTHFQNVRAI